MSKSLAALALLASMWGVSRFGAGGPWVGTSATSRPVKILQFYATVGSVQSGEKAQLCYSVENAKTVRISPLLPGVYPSARRCIDVVPDHTTHYTIMAVGFDGATAVRSLTLPVRQSEPAPAEIRYVAFVRRGART